MRVLKVALAALFLAGSMVTVGSVVTADTAVAQKAKKAKAQPGKCGAMNYYDKKSKSCKSKA